LRLKRESKLQALSCVITNATRHPRVLYSGQIHAGRQAERTCVDVCVCACAYVSVCVCVSGQPPPAHQHSSPVTDVCCIIFRYMLNDKLNESESLGFNPNPWAVGGQPDTYTHIHARGRARAALSRAHTHTHTPAHAHTHAHRHTHTHTHTHTHAHTHTHTRVNQHVFLVTHLCCILFRTCSTTSSG